MFLYLKVTDDKYEFPIVIADSLTELAEKLGISKQSIKTCMYLFRHGKTKKCRYVKVEVDDDD